MHSLEPSSLGGLDRVIYWRGQAVEQLPAHWFNRIASAAKTAARGLVPAYAHDAKADVFADYCERYAGVVNADMSDHDIRVRAKELAQKAMRLRVRELPECEARQIIEQLLCENLKLAKPDISSKSSVESISRRVCCDRWWRRALRGMVARLCEAGERELGFVGAKAGAWYCSNRSVKRRVWQLENAKTMMQQTVIENGHGERMTLWDASQTTVANREIRRGELMTRIRGCEEWADENGLVGLFTTNTCPSRFHAQRHGGGRNPKFDGSTPEQGQRWLCETWARVRSKWKREGINVVGFRVAEPHHDGTPHWHMLLWVKPEDEKKARMAMVDHWLREDEIGATRNRLKIKRMIKGMASGYVAKYIAKNIDDHGVEWHDDEEVPNDRLCARMLGDIEVTPSMRVEAWASTWRIRQFQAIGQPPVTVWRELRRVSKEVAVHQSSAFLSAWLAVHRDDKSGRKADWNRYMRAQGGAGLGREGYRFCTFASVSEKEGRYGVNEEKWVCGVFDRGIERTPVTPTKRQRWGSEGFSRAHPAPAWTRLNNCTPSNVHNRKKLSPVLDGMQKEREQPLKFPDETYKNPLGLSDFWYRFYTGE